MINNFVKYNKSIKGKIYEEIYGNYWHKYPTGKDIDHIRTRELLEKGFKVLRLWEFEINKMSITEFKEKLNGI